jgi:hypothetical protein
VIVTPTAVITPTVIVTPTAVITPTVVITPTAVVTPTVPGEIGTPPLNGLTNKDIPPASVKPKAVGKPTLGGTKPLNKPARPPRSTQFKTHKISLDFLRSVPYLAVWIPLDDWTLVVPQLPIPPSWGEAYRQRAPMQALSL